MEANSFEWKKANVGFLAQGVPVCVCVCASKWAAEEGRKQVTRVPLSTGRVSSFPHHVFTVRRHAWKKQLTKAGTLKLQFPEPFGKDAVTVLQGRLWGGASWLCKRLPSRIVVSKLWPLGQIRLATRYYPARRFYLFKNQSICSRLTFFTHYISFLS